MSVWELILSQLAEGSIRRVGGAFDQVRGQLQRQLSQAQTSGE
jgi:hypothetical protein